MSSLYERLGGKDAIDAAVEIFYKKVLDDSRIKHFFEGVNMSQQIAKQKAFLKFAFGGPTGYTGKSLRDAHAPLVARGLNNTHFDAVVENLAATLVELKVNDNEIKEVAAVAESVRNDILGR